ncbi:MAG: winged helix-turn-helix transcriptional regulator [Lentisphaerae bacterium]|nr:winged helix-turn-helix transcriptional regulator [Lentisphaerota bacterium]
MDEWLNKLSEISGSKDSSGLPLYQRLIESISQMIADGRMSDAMRLPPDTVMAAQLGISHITWAKVLNELRKRGVVERSRQRGTFIRKPRRSPNAAVSGKSSIAVFMDTITPANINMDYMGTIYSGLVAAGFQPAFISAAENRNIQYEQVISAMTSNEYSGGIIWSILDEAQINSVIARRPSNWPLIFTNTDHAPALPLKHDLVCYDGVSGINKEVKKFLRSGGKKVIFLVHEIHLFWRGLSQIGRIHEIFAEAGIPPENLEVIRCKDAVKNPEKLVERQDDSLLILAAPLEINLLSTALKSRGIPLDSLMPALAFTATGQPPESTWTLPSYVFDASELAKQSIRCLLRRIKEPSAQFHHIMIQGKLNREKNDDFV